MMSSNFVSSYHEPRDFLPSAPMASNKFVLKVNGWSLTPRVAVLFKTAGATALRSSIGSPTLSRFSIIVSYIFSLKLRLNDPYEVGEGR